MNQKRISGSCLCGAVTFSTDSKLLSFRYCTCRSCQKTTGSAHAANFTVPRNSLIWHKGEELISKYVEVKNNPGFPTWFCSQCGSFLPHVGRSGEVYVVPAGLVDSSLDHKPEEVIYWNESAGWYEPIDSLRKHSTDPETKVERDVDPNA